MNEILRTIRAVRRRIYYNIVLKHFLDAGFYLCLALVCFVLVAKLVFFPDAFSWLALASLCAVVLASLWALALTRLSQLAAALAADERLALAERLSSALALAADESPMARAVVEDAREHARAERLADKFPLTLPPRWYKSAGALVALAIVLILPQFDLLGRREALRRRQKEKQQVAEEVAKTVRKLAALKRKVSESDVETIELLEMLEAKLAEVERQGMGKEEALAAMSQSLQEIAERMKKAAKELAKRDNKDMDGLSAADREAAKNAAAKLAEMQKAIEKGDLSDEEMRNFSATLDKMAEAQAEKAAAAKEQAENLQKQLEQGALSDEQARQLADAISKLQQSAQANQQLANALSQMAAQMQSGQMSQMASSLVAAQAALSGMGGYQAGSGAAQQIQAMADALASMDAFADDMTGGNSISLDDAIAKLSMMLAAGTGETRLGMLGEGIGEGNLWNVGDQPTSLQSSMLPGQMRKGRVLASYFTEGGQLKNESRVEYQDVLLESQQEAKSALGSPRIPKAYRNTVRNYFESLKTGD